MRVISIRKQKDGSAKLNLELTDDEANRLLQYAIRKILEEYLDEKEKERKFK